MPLSPERAAAYAKLEEAIEGVIAANNAFDEGQIPIGFVLIVAGVRPMDPVLDIECFDPDDGDEEQFVSSHRAFCKRGQLPHTTRGIIEAYLDLWRSQQ